MPLASAQTLGTTIRSIVIMPRYSVTMQKGTVIKWLKNEGEIVEKGTSIDSCGK